MFLESDKGNLWLEALAKHSLLQLAGTTWKGGVRAQQNYKRKSDEIDH